MIIELLKEIARPGLKSNADLGRHLGVSESMIEELLSDLQNRGYLQRQEVCDTGCKGCMYTCTFSVTSSAPLVFWELTEKGKKMLKNH